MDDSSGDTHVAIADAMEQLGLSRLELLHRLRLGQVGDLIYAPARGGWFLPQAFVDEIATEIGADQGDGRPSADGATSAV